MTFSPTPTHPSVRGTTFRTLMLEAGGLALLWACTALGFEHYAPVAVVIFVTIDAARRRTRNLGFPRAWCLLNGLALALAGLDITMRDTTWAPLAGVTANAATAAMFALGATGTKPLVQEIAEQRQGSQFPPDRTDLRAFFRAYTLIWSAYFAIRAAAWFWMEHVLAADRAHALQSVIGPVSLLAMIGLSFRGKALFLGLKRYGLFRHASDT